MGGDRRLLPEPSILVNFTKAYEGLDAPEVAVVAALGWLERNRLRALDGDPRYAWTTRRSGE